MKKGETQQDTPAAAAAAAAGGTVRRTLTAKALGAKLGRTPRVVGNWMREGGGAGAGGCPHEVRKGGGKGGKKGGVRAYFNEAEVRAWLARRGVAETTERSGPREPVGEAQAQLPLLQYAENKAQAESMDFRLMGRRVMGTVQEVLSRKPAENSSPQTVRQWADSVRVLSNEARQLEAAVREADEREDRVMPRPTAAAVLRGFLQLVRQHLENMPVLFAQRRRERAEQVKACGDEDARTALEAVMLRELCDDALGLMADQVERDGKRLEGGESAAAAAGERRAAA